ncbi:MAG: hypothetical protein JOZ52_12925 [Acidobacteria bacterium]|nr:hypothetical protein [Acidobacteriota bacterium]
MSTKIMIATKPDRKAFTNREWRLIQTHTTPRQVQHFLSTLPYNWEEEGETQRSFRQVLRLKRAHCMEAALSAAVMLEQHGYPPLIVSLESQDKLDHVIFVFKHKHKWGAVARSRDTGLHGRKPVFHTLRSLVWSYFDPYVDLTGRITGYGLTNLYELGNYDWRFSSKNLWKVENHLREIPHTPLKSSEQRYKKLVARYKKFRLTQPTGAPTYFASRKTWML